jgi:hypothetical protein
MAFVAWTEIESFHNVRKFMKAYPENLNGNSTVLYRCKVKLHGTNAAIQVHADGNVVAQSRTAELVNGADNAGFAKWVESTKEYWKNISLPVGTEGVIIFGEWCGPGIQKGVALNDIPNKVFAVFAARVINNENILEVEPALLQELVGTIPNTHVLPWYNDEQLSIDWAASSDDLVQVTSVINGWVNAVEENDPWVEQTFNVKGTGEGLVFYPASTEHLGNKNFNNLVFKAKGDKHKNIKTASPAQVNPEHADSINQFVDLVLTEARLEQGANGIYDMKEVGKFLAWISNDVQKETQDELEASNLTWAQVSKAISNKARSWYLNKVKSL